MLLAGAAPLAPRSTVASLFAVCLLIFSVVFVQVEAAITTSFRGATAAAPSAAPAAAPSGVPASAPAAVWEPPLVSRCKCGAGGAVTSGDAAKMLAEVKAVRRLSDEIERTEIELRAVRLKLQRAEEYHEKHEAILRKQLAIRARSPATNGTVRRTEKYYAKRLCALVADSRLLSEAKSTRELQDICLGRKHLALSEAAACPCESARKTSLLATLRQRRTAPTVLKLQTRLNKLQGELVEAKKRYAEEPERWREERKSLAEEEARKGESAAADVAERLAGRQAAWNTTRDEICALLNNGTDVATILSKCD